MTDAAPTVRRQRLSFAVEHWSGGAATLYGIGHALLLALIAGVDHDAAARLHDQHGRKAFALEPLTIAPLAGGLARAELAVATWDGELGDLVQRALACTLDRPATIAGHSACVLDVRETDHTTPTEILATCSKSTSGVRVRFASPTFFSFGRGPSGRQRYGLLPEPGLVVRSWVQAWQVAEGETFGLAIEPARLSERVAVRWLADLHTQTVDGGKTALTGFLGEVGLSWVGPEEWGPTLLAALARFSTFSGTGAKTGHGFGWTELRAG